MMLEHHARELTSARLKHHGHQGPVVLIKPAFPISRAQDIKPAAESRCITRQVSCRSATSEQAPSLPGQGTLIPCTNGDQIYSLPQLYELAFSYRDLKQEVKFLRDIYKKHAGGSSPLSSVLDLGCGPGAHAHGLAAAGVPHVVGLELNPKMLEYAQSKETTAPPLTGKQQRGKATFVQGDMRAVKQALEAAGMLDTASGNGVQNFDMVTCLLGTFSHLLTNRDAIAAFKGVAAVMRPGGVFVLELAHPGDLFDGTLIIGDGGKEMWEVPQGKDAKLLVEWGAEFDNFDPVTQIVDRTVSINRFQGEEVVQSVEEVVPARQYTVQEVELLCDMSGLEVKQLYGDMSATVGLSHEDAYRLVAVIKKPLHAS